MTCVNCNKMLSRVTPPVGVNMDPYYYHTATQMIWCFDPGDTDMDVEKRHLRATPSP